MAVLILRLPRAFDSTMQTDSHRTEKLVKEYTARASAYDARWSTYLGRSLLMSLDVISELPAKRVLDVGCGTGQLLEMLAKRPDHPDLFGIGRVPAMLDVARRRIGHRATLLHGDAAKLPFDDAIFQLVASTYALHCFPDAESALGEIRRVMSPSGHLMITDWCRDYFWMRVLNGILPFTRHAHVHTFNKTELELRLNQAGFKTIGTTRRKIDWFWVRLQPVNATSRLSL
ncbi:MAG: class I SAM-dependent methyltransferase [Gammaproteobacteria bacterium]|nr:class I SAM-dependent methyltransferase [Gammaproteobacteria bacterium]MDH4314100.1 class I SAM-dependent methyltransferase [Gammaproteobacteria bacterium]MDH5213143.1 class I SAM-dependent methyltransferase [Gammaproteobacteria bacterium]MDH5499957.1 class I SAM-dependent methyltransferase [Gammaproteobacteria bacterium]